MRRQLLLQRRRLRERRRHAERRRDPTRQWATTIKDPETRSTSGNAAVLTAPAVRTTAPPLGRAGWGLTRANRMLRPPWTPRSLALPWLRLRRRPHGLRRPRWLRHPHELGRPHGPHWAPAAAPGTLGLWRLHGPPDSMSSIDPSCSGGSAGTNSTKRSGDPYGSGDPHGLQRLHGPSRPHGAPRRPHGVGGPWWSDAQRRPHAFRRPPIFARPRARTKGLAQPAGNT